MVGKRKGTWSRGWTEASRKEAAETESFLCGFDKITPDSSERFNANIWIHCSY